MSTAPAKSAVPTQEVSLPGTLAYAAPLAGSFFFYVPMWSILPGIYGTYFGLPLTSIAAILIFIRLFDGVLDTTIGYLADWHRATGGSRKSWVIVGGLGSIAACYFLFHPPQPATAGYYLTWSMIYFLAFTIAEIPHATWGSELTLDYQRRARVFGVRHVALSIGTLFFYALPLLPLYTSTAYTPAVLQDGIYVGAVMTVLGLAWALFAAPAGSTVVTIRQDNWRLFFESLVLNKPLLIYFAAAGSLGLALGMWFGLIFFYLNSYLGLGAQVAVMFLISVCLSTLSTPLWLKLIKATSKSTAWVVGVGLFAVQLTGSWLIHPGGAWWWPFLMVIVAHLFFACHNVASPSILGDIIDYGKLKFHKDRGATYFGLNTLIFKVGLGIGGGLALGVAGLFGFDPAQTVHSDASILGMKLGFVILPACFSFLGLVFIWRLPIDRRRHGIIQRRLASRLARSVVQPAL